MNAVQLSNKLQQYYSMTEENRKNSAYEAANMLRLQADHIAELEKKLQLNAEINRNLLEHIEETSTPQTKPLSDEEIWELAQPHGDLAWQDCTLDFARAIEAKVRGKK